MLKDSQLVTLQRTDDTAKLKELPIDMWPDNGEKHAVTLHTHTHTYIYMYIYLN